MDMKHRELAIQWLDRDQVVAIVTLQAEVGLMTESFAGNRAYVEANVYDWLSKRGFDRAAGCVLEDFAESWARRFLSPSAPTPSRTTLPT